GGGSSLCHPPLWRSSRDRSDPRHSLSRHPRGAARARGPSVGASRPDGENGENSLHLCLAEREDRSYSRDDHGESLMLDRLRALRKGLLYAFYGALGHFWS